MAWFGEGLSSLKGQITNFTKDIVVNSVVGLGSNDTLDVGSSSLHPEDEGKSHVEKLILHCKSQDEEIAKLKAENEKLRRIGTKRVARDRRVSEEATLECEEASAASSHLPLVPLDEAGADSFLGQDQVPKDVKVEDDISSLRSRLRQTFQEKVLMEQSCSLLEKEVALLTRDRERQASVRQNMESFCQNSDQATQTEGGPSDSAQLPHDSATLAHENQQLKREKDQLRAELSRVNQLVQVLESQVALSQDENANLSTGMEALDIQHQEAIEQIMVQKETTQKRYECLLAEYEELQKQYKELGKSILEENESKKLFKAERDSKISFEIRTQVLNELSQEIKNMITTEIPDKYFETSKKDASVLETVAAVEKMLSHTMSRVDSSEIKIRELLKELRIKDEEFQEIDEQNKNLSVKIAELRDQYDDLPTIAENNEDLDALESKVINLENEVGVLREVRSNLEVELNNSRSETEALFRRLQTTEAMIRNQENLQTEVSKYKESERELMKNLDNAEHIKEEMLTTISQLENCKRELETVITENKQKMLKLEEETQSKEQLQEELCNSKEKLSSFLKVTEELQQEKVLRVKLEDEKAQLLCQLNKIENEKENSTSQCADLEIEETLRFQIEEGKLQLKETIAASQQVEREHAYLLEKLESERKSKRELEVSLDTMHAEMKRLEKEEESMKQMLQQQGLETEIKTKELKALNTCLTQNCVKFEKEIFDLTKQLDSLKMKMDSKDRKLCEIILEKSFTEKELDEERNAKKVLEAEFKDLNKQLEIQENTIVNAFKENVCKLVPEMDFKNISDYLGCLNQVSNRLLSLELERNQLAKENDIMSEKIQSLVEEVNEKSDCTSKITAQMETLQAEKHSIEDRLRNLKETVSTGNQTEETNIVDERQLNEVQIKLEEQEFKFQELEVKYQTLMQDRDQSISGINQQLQTLSNERQQLIETVQTKHAECLKYHSEIQRLCAELTKAEQQRVSVVGELRKQLQEKEEQLSVLQANSDRQVSALTEQIQTLQNQLEYVSQLLRVTDRQEAEGQPASDSTSSDTKTQSVKSEVEAKEETRRIEELYESLQQEQLRNKYLQDEVSEQHDKEASLLRELQRLRGHLVSVEENYTQEMLRAEQQTAELNQRLALAEERAKSSSTAYTSASIRANQHVESLSAQLRLMTETKDKLSAQLAMAEDRLHKQAAALTNLQIVLEQFQRDKERDVAMDNERIRQTLDQANSKNTELSNEIKALQGQLKEAKEGLSAASRLTEQLDHKSQLIAGLKQQVSELLEKLKKAEERIQAASVSVEGKVDRCLVRNLVVGYASAPAGSKQQALSVVATVLDFSPEDRQRSGLDPGSGTSKQQSLSEAFVRFLENESRPHHHLMLPSQERTAEESRSRKTSVTEVGLPPARRTSGSVLKDVLKQDL